MQLDDRARAAAAALEHAVPDIPVPYREPSPRRSPVIAFAVLIVLVLIAGVALSSREEKQTDLSSPAAPFPRFIVAPTPVGFTATGAADIPLAEAPEATADIAV